MYIHGLLHMCVLVSGLFCLCTHACLCTFLSWAFIFFIMLQPHNSLSLFPRQLSRNCFQAQSTAVKLAHHLIKPHAMQHNTPHHNTTTQHNTTQHNTTSDLSSDEVLFSYITELKEVNHLLQILVVIQLKGKGLKDLPLKFY